MCILYFYNIYSKKYDLVREINTYNQLMIIHRGGGGEERSIVGQTPLACCSSDPTHASCERSFSMDRTCSKKKWLQGKEASRRKKCQRDGLQAARKIGCKEKKKILRKL
mmetsp:Transcript_12018/g.15550  ORF Transcript_12018/g.15550 Transcript_12018/m.15550 type:complete len:109 (+) Transcript_12018:104-430(+)